MLLPQEPSLICFVDPDYSLVVFNDNIIFLTDMSTQYTVEPTVYSGHESTIVSLEVFLDDFFISMDLNGTIKLWSLKDTAIERRRRSNSHREALQLSARQHINSECFGVQNVTQGLCIQTIDNQSQVNRNACFVMNQLVHNDQKRMFVGTRSGHITTYQWNINSNMFDHCRLESFDTKIPDLARLYFIPNMFLLVFNKVGASTFFNLTDQSHMPCSGPDLAVEPPIGVHQMKSRQPAKSTRSPNDMAIVYCNRIYYISVSPFRNIMSTEMREMTLSDEDQNFITCSTATEDNHYLVLGTKKGIIIYDPDHSHELLRSSVSDNIKCIDVCSLDDPEYKYIIISATKKGGPAINVHGILMENDNSAMQWVSNKIGSPINENNLIGRESMNAWLSGGQLFDAVEDLEDDHFELVAADSHMFVHQKSSRDHFVKSVSRAMVHKITALTFGLNAGFVACDSGLVFMLKQEEPYMKFNDAITYLKYHEDSDVLIVGTNKYYQIRQGIADCFEEPRSSLQLKQTIAYEKRYIILIKDDCSMDVSISLLAHRWEKQ